MLEESQVTVAKLTELFQSAFLDVKDIDEDSFKVKGVQFAFWFGVTVYLDRKMIRFSNLIALHRISLEGAALLSNKANNNLSLAKFHIIEHQGSLIVASEYTMSFEKGVIPFQIISNFRLFERVAGTGLELFRDHLIA